VEFYANRKTRSAKNIGIRIPDLRILALFLFARSILSTWRHHDNDVNDVTAPYV